MIIGFPSESDQDFQDTLDLIKKIRFDHVLLFTYSERKGTDAVQFDGKLSNQIKKERLSKALNFFRKEKILAICHNA
jgi:tRNA-2-methylthio-N6-dimethylallyladenosine synthase